MYYSIGNSKRVIAEYGKFATAQNTWDEIKRLESEGIAQEQLYVYAVKED